MKAGRGFTLIELLVVVAIIALLSSVVLAALTKSRLKARDAQRVAEIRQLMHALELYYDANGHYPYSTSCGATVPNTSWCNSVESLNNGHWIRDAGVQNVLAPYLSSEPTDPAPQTPNAATWSTDYGVYYYFTTNAARYKGVYVIVFHVENTPSPLEPTNGVTDCLGVKTNYGSGSNGVLTVGQSCAP